ncbi:hypothetical protein D4S03_04150 [bacterium]|nr:MAG: hypothetical protein D4S03_04150 [bacterium]
MSEPKPTNCKRCGASLERGYVQKGEIVNSKMKITETICFQCDKIERWEQFAKTGTLLTHTIMDLLYLHGKYERPHPHIKRKLIAQAVEASELIDKQIAIFEDLVWFGNPPLQKVVVDCRTHGMKYEDAVSGITFMAYDIAGRTMITVEGKSASISLLTATDYKENGHMGLQGICATKEEALDLLNWAITNRLAIVNNIKPDTKVNIGI